MTPGICKPIHISAVRAGDTVIHDKHARTVCRKDLKSGFMGKTLWGDSYHMGTKPVILITYDAETKRRQNIDHSNSRP